MNKGFATQLVKGFMKLIFRIEINGAENLPETGSCMVCSNHISNWDPVLLQCFLPRMISFMCKEEVSHIPLINSLLRSQHTVFVKRGKGDIGAMRACMKSIDDGRVLGIFPTGTREKKHPGAEPKSGAALIAAKTGAIVVPVSINADYRLFSKVKVNVGKPIDYSSLRGQRLSSDELAKMTEEIYNKIKNNY